MSRESLLCIAVAVAATALFSVGLFGAADLLTAL